MRCIIFSCFQNYYNHADIWEELRPPITTVTFFNGKLAISLSLWCTLSKLLWKRSPFHSLAVLRSTIFIMAEDPLNPHVFYFYLHEALSLHSVSQIWGRQGVSSLIDGLSKKNFLPAILADYWRLLKEKGRHLPSFLQWLLNVKLNKSWSHLFTSAKSCGSKTSLIYR